MGFGIGVAYAVMPALIVERTPRDRTASATGINQVLRLMGGAVGAAGAAAILAAHVPPGRLDPEETGYVLAAVAAVVAAVAAAIVAFALVPADRAGAVDEAPPTAVSPLT